jgi:spermidine/putrescine transport system permease protein
MAQRLFDWRRTPGLGLYAGAVFFFLYAPLAILVAYAFNANPIATVWTHASLAWFWRVLTNADIQRATRNTLIVAVCATVASTAIAVAGAIALERGRNLRERGLAVGLVMLPLVVPEIVTAITTLVFFSAIGLRLGLGNLVIAHTVFCIPFALLPIQARLRDIGAAVEDAARDLYADEWRVFRRVTLPLLMPAVLSGALLAFVVSLDDFLISLMVSEPGATTLPIYIYGMMRVGVTPEINAVSTLLLLGSLTLVVPAMLLRRDQPAHR